MASYELKFCGVPFVTDKAVAVSINKTPRKYQPLPDFIDEINRLLPMGYLNDFSLPSAYPGRNLGAIAREGDIGPQPSPQVRIGDWYYPTTAARWSVFRYLATSRMAKAMLEASQTVPPPSQILIMKSVPNDVSLPGFYAVQTPMRLLPPRCIGETAGSFDGLYLITLVDERFYFQGTPVSLRAKQYSTWDSLLLDLALAIGITLNFSPILPVYGQPEPDSQLWTNIENAATMLDAVAYNVGRIVVREFDGTYSLLTPIESRQRAATNRFLNAGQRSAGGDIFQSGTNLPAGDLRPSRNLIVPQRVTVSFPKYVYGDDPVPHFLNTRYGNQRQSAWYEESYGETENVVVPIASGGPFVSGATGVSDQFVHTTAKALYPTEAAAGMLSGNNLPPENAPQVIDLALQLASDYYAWQVGAALDESYKGTFLWTPEGFHDICWTYSEKQHQAVCRVMKTQWNQGVVEFQHSFAFASGSITSGYDLQALLTDGLTSGYNNSLTSGYTNTPRGVGGPSVAQTWRDSYCDCSGLGANLLAAPMDLSDQQAVFDNIQFLPTQNRWRAIIDSEIILFEGTSGGILSSGVIQALYSGSADPLISGGLGSGSLVDIVYRGIDGTDPTTHLAGTPVYPLQPHAHYGINLVTAEKSQFVFPQEWTSGGVMGVNMVPQLQTVMTAVGETLNINGVAYYLGNVMEFDPTQTSFFAQYRFLESVWIQERNGRTISSGTALGGQFVGFSPEPVLPIYLVNVGGGSNVVQLIPVVIKTTSFTTNDTETIYICDFQKITDTITATLPNAVGKCGLRLHFKMVNPKPVGPADSVGFYAANKSRLSITGSPTRNIDTVETGQPTFYNSLTPFYQTLFQGNDAMSVVSDGTQWWILVDSRSQLAIRSFNSAIATYNSTGILLISFTGLGSFSNWDPAGMSVGGSTVLTWPGIYRVDLGIDWVNPTTGVYSLGLFDGNGGLLFMRNQQITDATGEISQTVSDTIAIPNRLGSHNYEIRVGIQSDQAPVQYKNLSVSVSRVAKFPGN